MSTRLRPLVAAIPLVVVAAAMAMLWRAYPSPFARAHAETGQSGFSVALVGDLVVARSALSGVRDEAVDSAIDLLKGASIAIGNLEMNYAPAGARVDAGVWATAPAADARVLDRLGIGAVSCANNHGSDNGPDTVAATLAALDAAGVSHAGCGADLAAAREPVVLMRGGRRVALLAATTSAAGASRATQPRPGILGRSGVRAVRYRADVTVDSATFALLQRAAPAGGNDEVALFGTRIQRGGETRVTFTADAGDLDLLMEDVRRARSAADVVILSLHSHEPGNARQEPADFVQDAGRRAIDAGADLVVGHGPHQLRGIERYGRGVILYSLGNFVFHYDQMRPATVDAYNGGLDLYDVALGAVDATQTRALPRYEEEAWWQSALAVVRFSDTGAGSVELHPIDLGRDGQGQRGTPRTASASASAEILNRLAAASAGFGTHITSDGSAGRLMLDRTDGVATP